MSTSSTSDQDVVFKKKKINNINSRVRKRKSNDSDDDNDVGVGVGGHSHTHSHSGQKSRKYGGNHVKSTTTTTTTTTLASLEKQNDMSALGVAFKSSGTASTLFDSAATRTIDIDGLDNNNNKNDNVLSGEAAEKMDGLYQGQSKYKEFVNKRQEKITQVHIDR